MSCRLCGSTDVGDVVLRASHFQLIRCRQCGLVRTEGAGLDLAYDADYYSAHALHDTMRDLSSGGARVRLTDFAYGAYLDGSSSWLQRLATLPVRNRLGGLPPRNGLGRSLLDVGSGDGDFLRRARTAGYQVVGQEVNQAAVASAKEAGLDVRLGPLEEAGFEPQSFDAVRLWHVLEHVTEPLGILKTAHSLLKSSGVLVVGVPDFDSPARRLFGARWAGLQLPFHRHHFSPGTLRRALTGSGFRVRSLRHRSVGTIYSSLTEARRIPRPFAAPAWLGLLVLDDALDLAGQGDTIDALASPS